MFYLLVQLSQARINSNFHGAVQVSISSKPGYSWHTEMYLWNRLLKLVQLPLETYTFYFDYERNSYCSD